jgi:hypothetical protein
MPKSCTVKNYIVFVKIHSSNTKMYTLLFIYISKYVYIYIYIYTFVNIYVYTSTGCFVMFSVITNIYKEKNKGPSLMERFTATGKLIVFFTTRDVRCVHHG